MCVCVCVCVCVHGILWTEEQCSHVFMVNVWTEERLFTCLLILNGCRSLVDMSVHGKWLQSTCLHVVVVNGCRALVHMHVHGKWLTWSVHVDVSVHGKWLKSTCWHMYVCSWEVVELKSTCSHFCSWLMVEKLVHMFAHGKWLMSTSSHVCSW